MGGTVTLRCCYDTSDEYVILYWDYSNCISQQKDVQRAVEGAAVVLSCSYNSSVVSSLLWYRQYPGSPPQFLIREYSGYITNPIPGMNITHIKKQRLVELLISSAAVTDSALYYCALTHIFLTKHMNSSPYLFPLIIHVYHFLFKNMKIF
uniref:Ig-like domain-containing protein n=1 Tax=Gadus morhua TaxID=8049 RepID=A0A8C5C5D2_GADMO